MSARYLSKQEVLEHSINKNIQVEGSDMGNKSFEIREELIKEYSLWKKLFKVKEEESNDDQKKEDGKRKIYD